MAEAATTTLGGISKYIFNRHALIHGAIMLGMVFTPVAAAAAAAGGTATIGDIALGAADMLKECIVGWGDGVGVVSEAFNNVAAGNIAPTSYEIGMMDHAGMVSHTVDPSVLKDSAQDLMIGDGGTAEQAEEMLRILPKHDKNLG